MYPSPIRVVSRSISPLSRVNSQKIVNNPGPPPPGMKTMYKPVYFEAVEMPMQQYLSMPREMHQSDIELQNKIKQLEEQVSSYRKQIDPETAKLQKVIAEQRMEIQALQNPNEQSITELRDQCKMYFTKYQQIEYERNELVHQLRLNEPQLERVKQLQDTIKDQQRELDKLKNENTQLKSKPYKLDIHSTEPIKQQDSNRESLLDTQRRSLEEQINKYRIQIDEVTHQYEIYRERHHQMDLDKMNFTQRIAELEMTTLHQQKEIDRLTVAQVNKQNENDLLRQRISQLEFGNSSVINQGLEMDVKRLREQLDSRSKEIEDLKNRNRDIESALLKSKEKSVELEILKGRFHTLEGQSIESQRYKVLSTQLEYELKNQQQQQQKYDGIIADLKRNEHRLQSEIQRLSDLLRIKDDDISRLTQDYRDNMASFQNQIKSYASQQQTHDKFRSQSDNYYDNNDKVEQLQDEIKNLKAERLQLQRTIESLQNTKIQLESHIVSLEEGVNKSKRSLQNQAQKSQQDQEKFEQYERQIIELHQQIDIYRKELELMYTRPDSRQPSQKFTIPSHQNSLL